MKKRTIRSLLKWSIPPAFILFALILVDYFVWDSDYVIPLFVVFLLFIVWLIILLLLRSASPHTRIESEPEYPGIIVYPRNHG
ncbi:MAG: hypothetical protein ACPHID_01020 [Thermoplasmatota archaeon]